MVSIRLYRFSALLAVFVLAACSILGGKNESSGGTGMLVVDTNPEPIKNKLNVYDSMARATKYNIDAEGRNLYRKINGDAPLLEKGIENYVNTLNKSDNRLQKAADALDFSIVYATVVLSSNNVFADNYVYETAARNLALEAIEAHQKAWFAKKNERSVEKWVSQEQKIIDNIDGKEKKNGSLTNEEYDYRKNQIVALMRLKELKDSLNAEAIAYADLIRSDPVNPDLEGRKFYALENFDDDYSVVLFQETAYRNRKEFALAKEIEDSLSFSQLRRNVSGRYSPVSRLDVNGKTIEHDIYEDELYRKAMAIANDLVESTNAYKKSRVPAADYLRVSAFEDLGVAVLTQVEVYYQLVMQADVTYAKTAKAYDNIKKEIRRLEKIRRMTNDEKLALFNAKITALKLEKQKAKISAERARALRALYFSGGLSPFKTNMLRQSDKKVSEELHKSFNSDLSVMLAGLNEPVKEPPLIEMEKGWAQKPNWLEDVVSYDKEATYLSPKFDSLKKTMQLGAYLSQKSAEEDWRYLSAKYAELNIYKPVYEVTTVNGKEWHRLIIKAEAVDLYNLCAMIKNHGDDCLLR